MNRTQIPKENKVRIVKWEKSNSLTQEEAEARLHQEGYQTFCWYDVAGAEYPKHKHKYDECLWILRGEMEFQNDETISLLKNGDRVYLPADVPHKIKVPTHGGVTFLVGQKKI